MNTDTPRHYINSIKT